MRLCLSYEKQNQKNAVRKEGLENKSELLASLASSVAVAVYSGFATRACDYAEASNKSLLVSSRRNKN